MSTYDGPCPNGGPDHRPGAIGRKTCAWCDELIAPDPDWMDSPLGLFETAADRRRELRGEL